MYRFSPSASPADSFGHKTMIDVVFEDNHLFVVNKPAMLPTMGVAEDRPSLLGEAKDYIRRKYSKPGNVYLGVVSRLDAPVTGVVLFARTSKAAGRLSKLFRERDIEKVYWAIVEGRVAPPEGELTDFLRKDERHRRVHTASAHTPGAQQAELSYRLMSGAANEPRVRDAASLSLVEVRPRTGRKHQIRVQLAAAGFPIVGDRKYGSRRTLPTGIALHSRRLALTHPVSKMQMEFVAALPASWRGFIQEVPLV